MALVKLTTFFICLFLISCDFISKNAKTLNDSLSPVKDINEKLKKDDNTGVSQGNGNTDDPSNPSDPTGPSSFDVQNALISYVKPDFVNNQTIIYKMQNDLSVSKVAIVDAKGNDVLLTNILLYPISSKYSYLKSNEARGVLNNKTGVFNELEDVLYEKEGYFGITAYGDKIHAITEDNRIVIFNFLNLDKKYLVFPVNGQIVDNSYLENEINLINGYSRTASVEGTAAMAISLMFKSVWGSMLFPPFWYDGEEENSNISTGNYVLKYESNSITSDYIAWVNDLQYFANISTNHYGFDQDLSIAYTQFSDGIHSLHRDFASNRFSFSKLKYSPSSPYVSRSPIFYYELPGNTDDISKVESEYCSKIGHQSDSPIHRAVMKVKVDVDPAAIVDQKVYQYYYSTYNYLNGVKFEKFLGEIDYLSNSQAGNGLNAFTFLFSLTGDLENQTSVWGGLCSLDDRYLYTVYNSSTLLFSDVLKVGAGGVLDTDVFYVESNDINMDSIWYIKPLKATEDYTILLIVGESHDSIIASQSIKIKVIKIATNMDSQKADVLASTELVNEVINIYPSGVEESIKKQISRILLHID